MIGDDDADSGEDAWRRGVAAAAGRLDVVAAAVAGLSRSRAAALIAEGAVWVGGAPQTRPAWSVEAGAEVSVRMPPLVSAEARPQDLPIRVVYQDADLVVVDKAAGMVVHPAAGHADGTLVNALLFHVRDLAGVGGVQRPGIVHRLDRGTSGLLVAAKHDAAHAALSAQFADKSAGRTYLAIARTPAGDGGTVDAPLGRHPSDRVKFAVVPGGRRAVTHWRVLGRQGGLALIQATLETGRTHQVRVHLAHIGAPLLGDPLYGRGVQLPPAARVPLDADRPLLHAWQLALTHPSSGERMRFVAPVPRDLAAVADAVGLFEALPESARPASS